MTVARHVGTATPQQVGRPAGATRVRRRCRTCPPAAGGADRVASGAGRCDGTGALVGDHFPVGPGRSRSFVPDILEAAGAMRCDVMAACGLRCPCPGRTGLSALLPSQMTRGLPSKPGKATVPFRSVLLRVMNWRAAGLLGDQVQAVRQVVLPG
jgi:hypothetical protein